MLISVDTLIDARWVIPVEPAGVLFQHSVVINDGNIVDVLPTEQAHQRYSASQHKILDEHALIPGLVNLHTHAAMTLLRGIADDLPLMDWLQNHIWPLETKFVSEKFVYDGTLLASAEMLRGGITCVNDMYFFPGAAAQATLKAKLRAVIGLVVIDFPTSYANDPEDYLTKGFALRDELRDQPLLDFCLAPHAPYTVGDKTFEQILTYGQQLDLITHIHLHETEDEIRHSLENYNVRPVQRLYDLGLIGPNLLAVHGVHLEQKEIDLLAVQGAHLAHCPTSNLKLASGIAPISRMLKSGMNVGLGTDSAASNNRLDMFAEMRLCALLAKAESMQADSLPAMQALRMATINGAHALGMEDRIGSITIGKAADIVAVDFSAIDMLPCYDPVSHLVYTASRENVTDVWVAGELLVSDRHLTHLDQKELAANARYWQDRIRVKIPS